MGNSYSTPTKNNDVDKYLQIWKASHNSLFSGKKLVKSMCILPKQMKKGLEKIGPKMQFYFQLLSKVVQFKDCFIIRKGEI